jgi:small subunit ribosomal protein S15
LKGLKIGMKKEENDKKVKDTNVKKGNVGSSEFQITTFTNRIKKLTEHLKLNKKDENTRRGLMKMVGKRKKLLNYVKRKSNDQYESIIKSLGLRR